MLGFVVNAFLMCFILDAAITVRVAHVLFDGSLWDEGRVLCITWYLHGPTQSLSWRKSIKKKITNKVINNTLLDINKLTLPS